MQLTQAAWNFIFNQIALLGECTACMLKIFMSAAGVQLAICGSIGNVPSEPDLLSAVFKQLLKVYALEKLGV